jgi:carboxyl-terminal processing protease
MKNKNLTFKPIVILTLLALIFYNCSKSDEPVIEDTSVTLNSEINDFIWRGLNEIYLWQADVPDLSNTKFFTTANYNTFYNNYDNTHNLSQSIVKNYFTFLNGYSTPESLFDALLYQKDVVDKFSYLVDDYVALENSFQGTSNSNGLDFNLVRLSGSNDVFGYVRYVANGSDASTKNINRGEFFLTVDGQQLTINNYANLLFGSNNNYTLGMANITNNSIGLNGKTVALTKTQFTENPILINKVIDANGTKVGYLMYNQFVADFDIALNNAIGQLKAAGITELVLDLRYNPGGRVSSAIALSSMITGQFVGNIFSKEQWNPRYQAYFEANEPESLLNRFTNTLDDGSTIINKLNLSKIYILTTEGTASASELVINSLDPYIDVVQIGTNTTGKYTASVTLYDASNYDRSKANKNHTYALQPLVLKSANVNGVTNYFNGLTPDYLITYNTSAGVSEGENILNMGILGDPNEPFLAKALSLITGTTTKSSNGKFEKMGVKFETLNDSKDFTLLGKEMFVDFKPIK